MKYLPLNRNIFKDFEIKLSSDQPFRKEPKAVGSQLIALDRFCAYLFFDDEKEIHKYEIPDDSDILNCGGYLDKLVKYRSDEIKNFLSSREICKKNFLAIPIPIFQSRSPLIDLNLIDAIFYLKNEDLCSRISVLDVGCTICEHWDFIDQLIRIKTNNIDSAKNWLYWHGVDISPLVIAAAAMTHSDLSDNEFKVSVSEGSSFQTQENAYDLTLCIGVMHNFQNPIKGLKNLIASARIATFIAIWIGDIDDGIWLTSHHSTPFFLFGKNDMRKLSEEFSDKCFLVDDFIPESLSTQNRHFVNLDESSLNSIGSYHLVITSRPDFFPNLPLIDFK